MKKDAISNNNKKEENWMGIRENDLSFLVFLNRIGYFYHSNKKQ